MAARTTIPVRMIAAIINQCGTKVAFGLDCPKMLLSTPLNTGHRFEANFTAVMRKGMLKSRLKLTKSHGLSPDFIDRKVRCKLAETQMPKTTMMNQESIFRHPPALTDKPKKRGNINSIGENLFFMMRFLLGLTDR